MRFLLFATLFLAACAASEPAPSARPGESGIWIANNAEPATLPFTLIDNRIMIEARINGRGPYLMAFDTGGSNIVTPDVAEALGLELRDPFSATGAGEGAAQAWHTSIREVAAGDVRMGDIPFLVMTLEPIRRAIGFERFDGLFGHELLAQFVTHIDYEKRELSFAAPARAPVNWFEGAALEFEFMGNLPRIEARVEGAPFQAIIDTGDRSSLTLFQPFAGERGFPARAQVRAVTGWGVGGEIIADVDSADLEFAGFTLADVSTRAPIATWSALRGRDLGGSIGNGVMRRFHVTFDYPRQRIFLRPNAMFAAPDPIDRSGVWFVQSADRVHIVVHSVADESRAKDAGLRAGDIVLDANGRRVAGGDLLALRALLAEARTPTTFRVRSRDGEEGFVRLAAVRP